MERRMTWNASRMLVVLVMVLAMVLSVGTVASAAETDVTAEKECYIIGDINSDGDFTTQDAVYTLFHAFFGPTMYPVHQNCDINGDGVIDSRDAVQLLYAVFFLGDSKYPEYALYGTVHHDYYEPAWSWTETVDGATATVTAQCACGKGSDTWTAQVSLDHTLASTCTAAGSQVYAASVTVGDQVYTSSYTKVVSAAGHVAGELKYDENQHYHQCANCSEHLNVTSHNWVKSELIAGTCQTQAVQKYTCSCGAQKAENLGYAEHTYVHTGDVLKEGTTCQYVQKFACSLCGDTQDGKEFENHNYVATITREATCQADGVKAYKCTTCEKVGREEVIPKIADAHVWQTVTGDVNATHKCGVEGCTATKKTVTTSDDGRVSTNDLQNASDVAIGDVTLSMDEKVKEQLGGDKQVQIIVGEKNAEELGDKLTKDQKEQIGDNPIYDIYMGYVGGGAVVDGVKDAFITVTLPYTLEEGEDADAITVWYIDDNGQPTEHKATYSNGYVTFQTNHFSYYTVTRLTPAERCARYGHIWTDVTKAATCTEDGYHKQVCQRCTATETLKECAKTGHAYSVTEVKAPTCVSFGYEKSTCENCGHTTSVAIAATGHDMKETSRTEATCYAAGQIISTCQNGCGHETQEVLKQLTHNYQQDSSKTVVATCTTGGYEIYVCQHCHDEVKRNETTPAGHNYDENSARWEWAEDDSSAVLCLTCKGCGNEAKTKAAVTIVKATCQADGTVKAVAYYNGKVYTEEKTSGFATGHTPGDYWTTDKDSHYYVCKNCGEVLEKATHNYDDGVVTKQATCLNSGIKTYTCEVCGHSKDELIKAVGHHTYNNGVVTKEPTCVNPGSKLFSCTACGDSYTEDIAATGMHTYDGGNVTVAAGCLSSGEKVYTCTGCGETKKETIAAIGYHTYDNGQVTVEPSCFKAGVKEYTCTACQATKTEIVPAIGYHSYDAGKVQQEATCLVDGVKVYVCEVCGDDREEAIPAVGYHTYDDGKVTKEPGCVENGEKLYSCTACGATRRETILAVGYHSYDDGVVTKEATCESKGLRVYTCSVCGGTKNETISATGLHIYENGVCTGCGKEEFFCDHEISIENPLDVSGYGICEGFYAVEYRCECGENTFVEIYEHNCDMQILSEEETMDGYSVTAQCTKCGFHVEMEQKRVAHEDVCRVDYVVSGKLSVNDTVVTAFDAVVESVEHYPNVEVSVQDFQDENICGLRVITYTCACGQEKADRIESYCQWHWQYIDGREIQYCIECGATVERDVTTEGEGCFVTEHITETFVTKDGKALYSTSHDSIREHHNWNVVGYELNGASCEDGVQVHMQCADCGMTATNRYAYHETCLEETQILSEGQLCGDVSCVIRRCCCGERQESNLIWNNGECQFQQTGWDEKENCYIYTCMNCGAELYEYYYEEMVPGKPECHWRDRIENVYMRDGQMLFTHSMENYYYRHNWQTRFELLGDTCEDGVRVEEYCVLCGDGRKYTTDTHEIDWSHGSVEEVSQGMMCGQAELTTYTCACGEKKHTEFHWVENNCMFEHVDGDENNWYYVCRQCGTERHENMTMVPRTEMGPCYWMEVWTYTYSHKGTTLFSYQDEYYTEIHNWNVEYQMLGGSCTDGILVHRSCTQCDVNWESVRYDHIWDENKTTEEVLSSGLLCGEVIQIHYFCVCGEHQQTEIIWNGDVCDFWLTEDGKDYAVYTCQKCGATRTERWESVPAPEYGPCEWKHVRICVYEKDGVELFTERREESYYTQHQWYTTYELLGKTCEDGVRVSGICAGCGETIEYIETGHHVNDENKTIRETVSVGQLCGDVELVTYSCVCGVNTRTELVWTNGQCRFEHIGWDEKEDCYIYRCYACGAERYERNYHEQVPGKPQCHWQHRWEYTYVLDGNVLFVYNGVNYNYEHVWESTYELLGDSCEDGVIVTNCCIFCGETNQYESYGHGIRWDHHEDQVLTPEGCCSIVVRRVYSCACGKEAKEETVWERYACEYEHIGREGDTDYFRCRNCDMTRSETTYVEPFTEQGQCWWKRIWTNIYSYKGEVVLEEHGEEHYMEHQWEYTYELLGESCVDGIHVVRTCASCGESREYDEYGIHLTDESKRVVEEVSGGVMCGSVIRNSYSCVCGENADTYFDWSENHCDFQWHEGEDGKEGYDQCATCGTIREYRSYSEPIPGGLGCQWQHIWGNIYTNNGVELFNQFDRNDEYRHEYSYRYVLMGDSCEDGVMVFEECIYCDHANEYERNHHGMDHGNRVAEDLSQGQMCGDVIRYSNACPCGEQKEVYIVWTNGQCDFQYTGSNSVGDVYTCAGCGTTRTHYQREVLDPESGDCWWKWEWVESYAKNGVVLFEESGLNGGFQRHTYVYSYELLGKTCEDGVQVTYTCSGCGHTDGYLHEDGHIRNENLTYRETLSVGQLCGDLECVHYTCVCGEDAGTYLSWIGRECNFCWDHDGEDENGHYWVYVCQECGATRTDRNYHEQVPGGSQCDWQNRWEYVYEKDGQHLFTHNSIHKHKNHTTTYLSSTLLGNTCEDGILVKYQCIYCGHIDENIEYHHNTRQVVNYYLSDYGMCYGYLRVSSCPCGEEEYVDYHSNCSWYHKGSQGDEGYVNETCENCGSTCEWTWNVAEVVDSCTKIIESTWAITLGDTVINETWTETRENHRTVYQYNPVDGQISCENGYYLVEICLECGETIGDWGYRSGHSTYMVDRQIIDIGVKTCGYVEKQIYSCCCGENTEVTYQFIGCNFVHHYDKVLNMWIDGCETCGIYRTYEYESELVEGETCLYRETNRRIFWIGNDEVLSYETYSTSISHTTVNELYLLVEGGTCEDGWYRVEKCIYCDEQWTDEYIRYTHDTNRTVHYDLTKYGTCGGYVDHYTCACGQEQRWSFGENGCELQYTGKNNEYGAPERYCEKCDTYSYIMGSTKYMREECRYEHTMYARLVRDGVTLLDLVETYDEETHTYETIGIDGTCGGEITEYMMCHYCGATCQATYHSYEHSNMLLDFVDLKDEGACGGYLRVYGCPCGAISNYEWEGSSCRLEYLGSSQYTENGVLYTVQTEKCHDCGMVIESTYYETNVVDCRYERHVTYQIWLGDRHIKTMSRIERYTRHNYQITDIQLKGSSCEDGVVITRSCVCGESYTSSYHSHETFMDESKNIDLTQYGSVCGAELQYYACACGQRQYYAPSGNCDLDCRGIECWVEGAVDIGQYQIDGWVYADSHGNMYTCAVTDPEQCHLKIRMAYAWLKEGNCTVAEYQVWQLGYHETYDPATGETISSWEYEIIIPTGNVMSYHNYEQTYNSEQLADGASVYTESLVCKDCGSSRVMKYYSDANGWTYLETEDHVNTLNDGQSKERTVERRYDYLHNGRRYVTYCMNTVVYADGRPWWNKYEYTFNNNGCCTYSYTYTDSDGGYSYHEGTHYATYHYSECDKEPTCSQPGVMHWWEECALCGEVASEGYYDEDPYKHNWWWNDEKQCFECHRCGLENTNGADGSIVLEDMTASHGGGSNYVIGYWQQHAQDFTVYISVILNDVVDGNDEIVLDGIQIRYLTIENDGICALAIDQAAVDAEVQTTLAEAGYTGSYAVRIAFVPADGGGELDYAITLDEKKA